MLSRLPWRLLILFAMGLLLAACGTPSASPTPSPAALLQTPCANPPPTPTDMATPTPGRGTPTVTPTPSPTPPPTPPSGGLVLPMPTPTPVPSPTATPTIPAAVGWQDAVVYVCVQTPGNYADQTGLVVDPGGRILTMLDWTQGVLNITVAVPGRGAFPATVQTYDPHTGAALLKIKADHLTAAPAPKLAGPAGPGLVLERAMGGGLNVADTAINLSQTAPDNYVMVGESRPFNIYYQIGAVVVNQAGDPVALAGWGYLWTGAGTPGL